MRGYSPNVARVLTSCEAERKGLAVFDNCGKMWGWRCAAYRTTHPRDLILPRSLALFGALIRWCIEGEK